MRTHGNRTHARTAAAMRNAEGLVQIQVGNVGTEAAWLGQPDHRVHIGAVQIYLAASGMNQIANLYDASSNTP